MSNDDIPINSGGQTRRPPSISLRNVNDFVDVAIINEEKVPAYEFGQGRTQKTTRDGKPKTQDAVTVMVIRGNGVIHENGADRPVQPGEVATIYFEGQNRWDPDLDKSRDKGGFKSWSGAKEDLGQLMVGDVARWMFEAEIPGKGAQPRKLRPVKLRRAKPEEADQTTRCKQLHREGTAIPVGATAGGHGPDEEPF